jgi:hypothetical protein
MAFRLYIVPIIGTGTKLDPRRPKYFADGTVNSPWTGMNYGIEAWMVVGADLSFSDDALVVGQVDAMALRFDLSPQLTAPQVTAVQNKLEAINLPAGWVNTSLTWLQVVRAVFGILSFMQRFTALNGNVSLFTGGITLNSTISALPAPVLTNLQQAAAELGLSTAGIVGTTTIRQALKLLGAQLENRQYNFNGTLI